METYLRKKWKGLAGEGAIASEIFNDLFSSYKQEGRYYHNLNHLFDLLELTEAFAYHLKQREAVEWAIWFHDAVYDVRRLDNEEKSAEMAREKLRLLGMPETEIDFVCELILATKDHSWKEASNEDALYFLDFDLFILSVPNESYEEYAKQIRKEYTIYSDKDYNNGRKKVLEKLLAKDRLYSTAECHKMWEERARENVQKELNSL